MLGSSEPCGTPVPEDLIFLSTHMHMHVHRSILNLVLDRAGGTGPVGRGNLGPHKISLGKSERRPPAVCGVLCLASLAQRAGALPLTAFHSLFSCSAPVAGAGPVGTYILIR